MININVWIYEREREADSDILQNNSKNDIVCKVNIN